MKKTKQFLGKLNLPGADNHALKPTTHRFPDGGLYRIEIPSVEGPRVFREVLEAAEEYRVPIHRVSQGSGIMLLTRKEIAEMARIGAENRIEVCLFVGPRAPFETGAQALTVAGKVIGWQHRGADQLRSEEHTSELQSPCNLVCRLLLEKKKKKNRGETHRRVEIKTQRNDD